MSYKINRKQVMFLLLWAIVTLIEYIYMKNLLYSNNTYKIVSFIVLINFFFQILILKFNKFSLVSFFTVFLFMLYLFHFGQVIVVALGVDTSFTIILNDYMSDKSTVINILNVSNLIINSIFLGALLTHNDDKSFFNIVNRDVKFKSQEINKKVGLLLFFMSLPFRLYIDITRSFIGYTEGYLEAYSYTFSGIAGAIASFWYIAIPIVYISITSSRRRHFFIGTSLIYLIITMMISGSRAYTMIAIISITVVIIIFENIKMKPKTIFKYIIISIIMVLMINVIAEARVYGGRYLFVNFSSLIAEAIKGNFIFDAVSELGGTIWTVYLVDILREINTPYIGETFLKSLITVIPNFFGSNIYYDIQREAVIGYVLIDNLNVRGIGGSFVAEMYYNFGQLIWFFGVLFGWLYNSLSVKLNLSIRRGLFHKVVLYLPFLTLSIFWVRDSFIGLVRGVSWIFILYLLVRYIKVNK